MFSSGFYQRVRENVSKAGWKNPGGTLLNAPRRTQKNGAATEPELPLTISRLVDQYKKIAEQHLALSTSNESSRTLDRYLIPAWGDRQVLEIRRRDAIALIDPIADKTPGQARGVLKNPRAMFNYALERELVESNPFTRLPVAVPSIKPVK